MNINSSGSKGCHSAFPLSFYTIGPLLLAFLISYVCEFL